MVPSHRKPYSTFVLAAETECFHAGPLPARQSIHFSPSPSGKARRIFQQYPPRLVLRRVSSGCLSWVNLRRWSEAPNPLLLEQVQTFGFPIEVRCAPACLNPPKGAVRHALCTHRPRMEHRPADPAKQATRHSPRGRQARVERHLLGLAIGCPMARSAGPVRAPTRLATIASTDGGELVFGTPSCKQYRMCATPLS